MHLCDWYSSDTVNLALVSQWFRREIEIVRRKHFDGHIRFRTVESDLIDFLCSEDPRMSWIFPLVKTLDVRYPHLAWCFNQTNFSRLNNLTNIVVDFSGVIDAKFLETALDEEVIESVRTYRRARLLQAFLITMDCRIQFSLRYAEADHGMDRALMLESLSSGELLVLDRSRTLSKWN